MSNHLVERSALGRDALPELRDVVTQWDWNGFHAVLDRALTGLPPERMVAVAEAMLRTELPRFEQYNPGETWPRRALDGVADNPPPESEIPGGNGYLCAVEELLYARENVQAPAVCRRWAVDSLTGIMASAMDVVWGIHHLDRWRQWFHKTHLGRPCWEPQPRSGWEQDPRVKEIQSSLGTDLADRLAAAWKAVD